MKPGTLIFIAACFAAAGARAECGVDKLPESQRASSASYHVGYTTDPSVISVASDFSVILEICRKDGAAYRGIPQADAHMPLHRHGMNYRPQITRIRDGKYRAEGFVFHMPGTWQFLFDIPDGNTSERITMDFRLN